MSGVFSPGMLLLLGALVVAVLPQALRRGAAIVLPLLALGQAWWMIENDGGGGTIAFLGDAFRLSPAVVHPFTPAFATVFCLMASLGALFAMTPRHGPGDERRVELPAALVYAGGALSVTFAGDWISLFVFWEIMTLGSTALIWSGGTQQSYKAGMRYFGVHAVGGVLMLAGIVLHVQSAGVDVGGIAVLRDTWLDGVTGANAGAWLILIGMLVNAGGPPFSFWIADAYPEATPIGTVFLSAYTTKTAVFTLMLAFPGLELLVYLGLFMAVYGIVYAILENDIRRILAYSIVNQVGFMVTGIGVGTELALNGATAHAFAHIIYKALLLMSAGAVVYRTGKNKCTEVGGLYRTMPVTMWCGIIGAMAISSFPLTSGFTTKSMITASTYTLAGDLAAAGASNDYLIVAWFVLEAASAGVFLHAGIKFPWFVFFQRDSGLRPKDAPGNMKLAMIILAGLCLFLGANPTPLYSILPFPDIAFEYGTHVYSFVHVVELLHLLLFSGLAFFLLLPLLRRTETISLDWDWLYRRLVPAVWHAALLPVLRRLGSVQERLMTGIPRRAAGLLRRRYEQRSAMDWPIGAMVVLITLLLVVYLLIHFSV